MPKTKLKNEIRNLLIPKRFVWQDAETLEAHGNSSKESAELVELKSAYEKAHVRFLEELWNEGLSNDFVKDGDAQVASEIKDFFENHFLAEVLKLIDSGHSEGSVDDSLENIFRGLTTQLSSDTAKSLSDGAKELIVHAARNANTAVKEFNKPLMLEKKRLEYAREKKAAETALQGEENKIAKERREEDEMRDREVESKKVAELELSPELSSIADEALSEAFESPEEERASKMMKEAKERGRVDLTHESPEVKSFITEIQGNLIDRSPGAISYPRLKTVSGFFLSDSSSIDFPSLTHIGALSAHKATEIYLRNLTIAGEIYAPGVKKFDAPFLVNVGSLRLHAADDFFAPALEKVELSLVARSVKTFRAGALVSVGESLFLENATIIQLPRLTSVGAGLAAPRVEQFTGESLTSVGEDLYLDTAFSIELPLLKSIGGNFYASQVSRFNAPLLEHAGKYFSLSSEAIQFYSDTFNPYVKQRVKEAK